MGGSMPGVTSTWELLTKRSVEHSLSALAKQRGLHCSRGVTTLHTTNPNLPQLVLQHNSTLANVSAFFPLPIPAC